MSQKSIVSKLSDLFSAFGSKSYVGIDIGLSGLKITELIKERGKYKLVNFSIIDFPEGVLLEDEIQKPDTILDALNEALGSFSSSAQNACIGLCGPSTVVRKLQVAGGTYEEVEDQVNWEVEQYLPFSIDECGLSFHIVGENAGGGVDVIIAAASNTVIDQYKNLIEESDLNVKVVDLNILSVINIFEFFMGKKIQEANESWIIIDIGAQSSKFIIYKNQCLVFSKEIEIGGIIITEEIQRRIGLTYDEAEDLKIKGDGSGNIPEEVQSIVDEVTEAFFLEIQKTLEFYVTSTSDQSMSECYLTGGSVQIPGIIDGLENLLGLPVTIMNPLDFIEVDKSLSKKQGLNELAYRGVVSLGLSMRGLAE